MQASNTKATTGQILVTFFFTLNDGTELLSAQSLKVALQVNTNYNKLFICGVHITGWY